MKNNTHSDMKLDRLIVFTVEDLERHDGSAEKPYFMSKDLMGIVGKKNKIIQANKGKDVQPGSDDF